VGKFRPLYNIGIADRRLGDLQGIAAIRHFADLKIPRLNQRNDGFYRADPPTARGKIRCGLPNYSGHRLLAGATFIVSFSV